MKIHERITNDFGLVELSGRLTITDEPGQVKAAVARLLEQGARHVVIDLSGVPTIDSTRLGELITAHLTLSRAGGRLILAGTQPRVLELLKVSSLAGVFEHVDSVDAASAVLSATPVG